MSNVRFNFQDYYSPNFIDPLYSPYLLENRTFNKNELINTNEVKINKQLDFRKKYSHYPCPEGYESIRNDYCHKSPQYIQSDLYKMYEKQYFKSNKMTNEIFPK
uniref:Uncharacterized protein n=1 Tax=viral metagenome TaxID=1070528 RepID=A0A6C0JST0_9ZZZZ